MKKMRKIVLFGGVGSSSTFGGEPTKNKEITNRLMELGCNVTVLDSYNVRSKKMKLIKLVFRFFCCILLYPKATFIFSTSFGNVYSLFKILYCLPVKLHIVYWVIGGNLAERISQGAYKQKYLKLVDVFIMEGIKMKKRMADLGFNNVWYEPNFKTIGSLPKIQKANDGRIHFFFLSRIMPDKGCRYIMECVKTLNEQGQSDKFVVDFYGSIAPEYREEFETAIMEEKNVNYCGSLQLQDNVNYDILARYHYMLFPTYWLGEGFPGVVIDAYKAGVPIISSDWNLNSEFIYNGETGIVIPTHSTDALRQTMENAIIGKYDNERMSERCQQEVTKYDTREIINQNLLDMIMNIKKSRRFIKILKHSKLIYFLWYKNTNKDYLVNKKSMATSNVKSMEQIKAEMNFCCNYWHCPASHYVRYGLYEKLFSKDEILDYIPSFYFYNSYMEIKLKGINKNFYGNKLYMYHLFRKFSIPTPKVVAIVKNGTLHRVTGECITIEELCANLKNNKKYFFKPVDGAGGTGIEVLKKREPNICRIFIANLNRNNIYVVQEGIEQRMDFMEINSSSVNTLRVITQYNGDMPKVCVCVMRIGRNGKDVDNSHQGGISCQVDVVDGTFHETATTEHGGGLFTQHPDTGFVFKGKNVDGWEQIKSSIIAYAYNFPELKEIGWDIAVTSEGISVIEMNLGYGIDHLQVSCGGMRRVLNVFY